MLFRTYNHQDQTEVISLWQQCGLLRPWNDPEKDIERKLKTSPDLFIVGVIDNQVRATAMAGYEGHRGWVNYLAVDPSLQKNGYGALMMREVETRLLHLGCPKINIQIRTDNIAALEFYRNIGYSPDEVVSVSKRLIKD